MTTPLGQRSGNDCARGPRRVTPTQFTGDVLKFLSYLRTTLVSHGVSRKFATNTAWAMSGQGVAVAVSLVETFLLARYLGPTQFGLYLVVLGGCELVLGLLDCKSGEAVIKFLPQLRKSHGQSAIGALMRFVLLVDCSLAFLGVLLVLVLVRFSGTWLGLEASDLPAAAILACGLGIRATMGSVGSYLRVEGAFPLAVQLAMATGVARILLCIAAVLVAPTLTSASLAVASAEITMGAAMFGALLWRMRLSRVPLCRPASTLTSSDIRAIAKFMLQTNLAVTIKVLSKRADVLLIAFLSSPAVVALYKVAWRIAGALLFFSDPLLTVIFPTLSNLYSQNRVSELKRLTALITRLFACVTVVVIASFILAGAKILNLLVGPGYDAALTSSLIMVCGFSLSMIFCWTRPLLLVLGLTGTVLKTGALAVAFQFAILWLLVPSFGALGAATATSVYQCCVVAGYLAALRRRSGNVWRPSVVAEGVGARTGTV